MRFISGERFRAVPAFFHDELVEFRVDGEGILPSETRQTKLVHRFSRGPHHSFEIEIPKTVDAEILTDCSIES